MKIGQLYTADSLYRIKRGSVLLRSGDVVMVTDIRKRSSEEFFGLKQADVYFLHAGRHLSYNSEEAEVCRMDDHTFRTHFTKAEKRVS